MKWLKFAAILLSMALANGARAADPVTVTEDAACFTLDNGTIKALISKKSGDLVSLRVKGVEQLATFLDAGGNPDLTRDPPGDPGRNGRGMTDHMYGFWSHDAQSDRVETKITIDPKTNRGSRAEVSVKGFSDGKKLGHGPGAAADGDFAADIDIRYSLGAADPGVYTYCTFDHKAEYPDATLSEARFCAKLNDTYDFMMIDEHHHGFYGPEGERSLGDNKYNYTTVQYDHPAFGFASTKNTGVFFLNASVEYLTGPPTKVEFECHRDTNQIAAPCILNYWRSSHYGGGGVDVARGEAWTKTIGPFLIYCNTGTDPDAIWKDAIAQQSREKTKWPYEWVNGVDYPHKEQRSTVTGTMALSDPLMPNTKMTRLLVGLSHPDYHITVNRPSAGNSLADITWQNDSKHYEFWADGDPVTGQFSIPAVRAGKYTLHAIAYGVMDEFAKAEVTVEAGKPLELGKLTWSIDRKGRQLWDIGIPNRSGREYVKGDDYFHDGMAAVYARMFPDDVNYTIGKSDFTKDWFYAQYPHVAVPASAPAQAPVATAPAPTTLAAPGARGGFGRGGPIGGGGGGGGRATTWTIHFDLPAAPKGKATLRVAIATSNTREFTVAVNDQPAGSAGNFPADSSLGRNTVQGIWTQRDVPFDASLMKQGDNTVKLTVPAGGGTAGIVYDYLRLELDENAR